MVDTSILCPVVRVMVSKEQKELYLPSGYDAVWCPEGVVFPSGDSCGFNHLARSLHSGSYVSVLETLNFISLLDKKERSQGISEGQRWCRLHPRVGAERGPLAGADPEN